jgi:GTP-binding protein
MLDDVWEEAPPYFITSSLHKTGGEELLNYIGSLNNEFANQG